MDAVFVVRRADEWDFVLELPPLSEHGDRTCEQTALFSVEVSVFSEAPQLSPDSPPLEAKTLYAPHAEWPEPVQRSVFLARQTNLCVGPVTLETWADVPEIASIRFEGGGFFVAGKDWTGAFEQKMQEMRGGGGAQGDDLDICWFLFGLPVPEVAAAMFHPPAPLDRKDWVSILAEADFVQLHTRAPYRPPPALALLQPEVFLDWLRHLPADRVRQLSASPSARDWILSLATRACHL